MGTPYAAIPDTTTMTVALLKAAIQVVGSHRLEVSRSADDAEVQWPIGVRAWLGTERVDGEDITDFSARITRCYELAAWGFPAAPEGSWLIHGSQHGRCPGNQRIAHAWLEIGEAIWEPITACLYDKAEFTEFGRLWEERRYNRVVATRLVLSHNHTGPWHESRYP